MAQKRLTKTAFKKMLQALPEFNLMQGTFRNRAGEPCGGCAMTLAYSFNNPETNLKRLRSSKKIIDWAREEFGEGYLDNFISAFDGGYYLPDIQNPDDEGERWVDSARNRTAYDDGIACRELACAVARLPQEDC